MAFHISLSESLPKYSDKCILPPSILEDALAADPQLPHPLVVALNDSLLVGVKEFTAPPNTILVPAEVLDKINTATVTCEIISSLERALSLTVKPLHFYPQVINWKYYLESFLSNSYTTLSIGQTFHYHDIVAGQTVSLVVEDANAPSVIVVDTDIVLDVTPLDDIMGAQQLQQNTALEQLENVPELDSAPIELQPFHKSSIPCIFKLDLVSSRRYISLSLSADSDICNVDILVGLDKLVTLENFYDCTMSLDEKGVPSKTLLVDTHADQIVNYMEKLKGESCWLYIVPFAWSEPASVRIVAESSDSKPLQDAESVASAQSGQQCSNCGKVVDSEKFQLHEAFCLRNNVRCSCGEVFTKEIPSSHWHCDNCSVHGNSATFKYKHSKLVHESPYSCSQCSSTKEYSTFIDLVQKHKSTECPAKLAECMFCHLILPQEEATYEDRFANLTHHESQCGNKTTECYQCGKVLRNKDMAKHLQMHTIVKNAQNSEVVDQCLNQVCSNILAEDDKRDNALGLCGSCYGPLYSTVDDKDNAKLQNRIERKYVLQLTRGCGNEWCRNSECSVSRGKLGIKETLTRVREVLLPAITHPVLPINNQRDRQETSRFWFCVNESIQEKRNCIDALLSEGEYSSSLIYKAVNKEGTQGAKSWLLENAQGVA